MNFEHFFFTIIQLSIIVTCLSQKLTGDKCKDSNGGNGICQLISECSYAREDLKNGIQPANCGFQESEPIVCCPTRKSGDIARYFCEKYGRVCPKLEVAGGVGVLPGEFPHMAAIGYGDQNSISWECGGTLISEKFVLTAAHCMFSRETGQARWVLLGAETLINTTSSDGKKGQIHPVVTRIRHPEYKPPSKYNDIALLEIGAAVTPNPLPLTVKKLHPACLAINKTYAGLSAVATGWGRVGHADEGSSELLKVKLDIFGAETCEKAYEVEIKSTRLLQRGIDSTMLCVGVLEGGKDTCPGDSGGPLQDTLQYECMYEVWGITSFGKICAFKNSPSVYTKVENFIPWIEKTVWG